MLRHMIIVASRFCVGVAVMFVRLEISIALFVCLFVTTSSLGNFVAV